MIQKSPMYPLPSSIRCYRVAKLYYNIIARRATWVHSRSRRLPSPQGSLLQPNPLPSRPHFLLNPGQLLICSPCPQSVVSRMAHKWNLVAHNRWGPAFFTQRNSLEIVCIGRMRCGRTSLFDHLPWKGVRCYQFLDMVNKAAVTVCIQMFVWQVSIPLR